MKIVFDKKWLYTALTFWVTMLVTCVVAIYSYQMQINYGKRLFESLAQRQTEILKEFVNNDLDQIGTGANFFYSTSRDEWSNFDTFAEQVMTSSQTLVTLQWMERVEKDDIPQYLAKVRLDQPDFRLYTIPKDAPVTHGYIMQADEPIYVARDIYPENDINKKVLGFYDSRLRFQLVIDNMRFQQKVSVSDKVRLLQDGLTKDMKKDGMLVYHPVFNRGDDQQLIGVVIGVIRTSHYFDGLMTRTAANRQLEVKVNDLGFDAEDDSVLFESKNWTTTKGFELDTIIQLPNRQWKVSFRLTEDNTANDKLILSAIVFGGFVIAILLSYIVFLQVRAQSHLASLLETRTEELRFLVNHDALTGLYNRRAFNEFITQAIDKDREFTLIGFDVDRFKYINDNYGHPGGDQLLRHVAATVEECINPDDLLVRLGGDEFCIISQVVKRVDLQAYLETIRAVMCERKTLLGGHMVTCTLSIGAAIRVGEDAEQIMQIADAQLYFSKNSGRNKVTIAE
ncbi:sensor domain-containing diguanylate cyclase [Vibrio kasasachensis]|uniref:sensor domain-containing diguanylate cyclase n=1 Tax=Vibrio kasasachensis TaxID=2910248 RepID=UPI003D0B32E6